MLASTVTAMLVNLTKFTDPLLMVVGGALVVLGVGVVLEAVAALRRDVAARRSGSV